MAVNSTDYWQQFLFWSLFPTVPRLLSLDLWTTEEKGATCVSYLYGVLLTGAPMGPLSPFSHAHADWAKGHFEHRGRALRWVLEGPMTGGTCRERVQAGFTHPFVCHGRLQGGENNNSARKETQFVGRRQELPPTARLSKVTNSSMCLSHVRLCCFKRSSTASAHNPELPFVTRPTNYHSANLFF